MRKRHLFIALGFVIFFGTASYAGSIKIPLPPVPPPPPVPDFAEEPHTAPEIDVVVPPPPTFISVEVSHPDYYFYDDDREAWFYYEKGRTPHYVRHHEWRDDGKHFYGSGKRWVKANKRYANSRGWAKHNAKHKAKKKWWRFWDDD